MNETILDYLIKALVLFTAVPVHECAHAWVAEKMGDDTGRKQGRITLNPFAHLTLWGSLMMILVGFGWGKPVMVDSRNFKNPKKGMVLTSLAGPASNFIMAFLSMIVYKVLAFLSFAKDSSTLDMLATVFVYITLINISLAVFNFLPIPPLDGSKIFNAILPEKWYFTIMKYENFIFIALIILVYSGLLDTPLSFLQDKVIDVMLFLTGWVDKIMSLLIAGGVI
ncbi:MAG: site-2 protease family protein [Oscillospiraceae bacterium]|nr:site-2 protease family protein [Oscillospiraceae bacterium]MDY2863535.1 site-2 protease family protein [Oscillospiraceae bacterium]